jgi:hypothetical protein
VQAESLTAALAELYIKTPDQLRTALDSEEVLGQVCMWANPDPDPDPDPNPNPNPNPNPIALILPRYIGTNPGPLTSIL